MQKLSSEAFQKAKSYILTHARDIEQVLFNYYFDNGDKETVVNTLRSYQNGDGGFGHGMEPDLRSTNSSVLATVHALEILRDIGIATSEMINNALSYIMEMYDVEREVWPIISSNVLDVPHPPWWDGDLYQNYGEFRVNPSVSVIAMHMHFNNAEIDIPIDFIVNRVHSVIDDLDNLSDKINYYEFRNYLAILEVPGNHRDAIIDKLRPILLNSLNMDPMEWTGFEMNPCNVIVSKNSPFIDIVPLDDNLDFDIFNQMNAGSWPINWSWEKVDPIGWKQADLAWRGIITLKKLLLFKEFKRLA